MFYGVVLGVKSTYICIHKNAHIHYIVDKYTSMFTHILHGGSTKQEFRSGCLRRAVFSEGGWIPAAVRWLPQMRRSHYVGW